jgi:NarL family two-component system response regulator LiaR
MSEAHTIRVLVVDDHEIIRTGIVYSLSTFHDLELVGEANSGREALELCSETQPDVVLMDMLMPGMDGVQTTRAVKEQHPQVQVLALTSFYDKDRVWQAMQAGAAGYLVKGISASELAEAIRVAHAGQTVLSPEATEALIQSDGSRDNLGHDLTRREREVLTLLVKGLSNAEIAQRLTITVSTTKHHVSAVLSKLGAASRAEAVVLAMEHGLITESTAE